MTLQPRQNLFQVNVWNLPCCNPNCFRTHQIPCSRRLDQISTESPRQSDCSPWISSMTNGRMKERQIPTVQTWAKGLARHPKCQDMLPPENGPKMRRTLWNRTSNGTPHIQVEATKIMENTQCVPCSATHAVHRNRNSWTQLPLTTTRYQ